MGITLKDMSQVSLSRTALRVQNRDLCEHVRQMESKKPQSRFDSAKHFIIPEVVAQTLSAAQKENFQKDGVLPPSSHQAYVSSCKSEQIQIYPKFRSVTKPQIMPAKNQ